jgi:multidrug efflux system membrane fusion protein
MLNRVEDTSADRQFHAGWTDDGVRPAGVVKAWHKKSGNRRAPFDTAAENPSARREKSAPAQERPTQGERQNTLTLHTQPLVLSSRPLLAAYRRAPAWSSCAKPAVKQVGTASANRRWCWMLAIGVCAAILLAGCGSKPNVVGPEAVPVNVTVVAQRDVPVQLRAIGNVEAYSTVTVRSQVDGELAQINFKEGQEVKEGDLLLIIDPRPFEAALRQAEANLARNRAAASHAEMQAKRYKQLLADNFVSKDQYDQFRTQAETFEAAVKADQAAVENTKLQLQYCYIHSPISGRIGQYLVHAGNVVKNRDTALATINRIRPVYVNFSMPEQHLPDIRNSAAARQLRVEAFVGADSTHAATGELSFIDNAVDTKTGTVLLKGTFPNEDEMLWPGQFVSVALTLRTQPNALLVPTAAIQTGQQGQYVFVVGKDLTAQVRPVVTGMSVNEEVVVEKGLELGETVVTRGQIRLAAGSKVQIKSGVDSEGQQGAEQQATQGK